MEPFWGALILIMFMILLFVILPNFVETTKPVVYVPVKTPPPAPDAIFREELQKRSKHDKAMLDSQYIQQQVKTIPEDYPRKEIGACPYSKPPSTDLPMIDVPMCMMSKPKFDTHLRT